MSVADERVENEAERGAPPLIQMSGIGKEFLGVRVLDGVDLDCAAGEVHAIVGENGAGKSTLMKILCGAYRPTRGRDPRSTASRSSSTTPSKASRPEWRSSTRSSTSCRTAPWPRTSSSAGSRAGAS